MGCKQGIKVQILTLSQPARRSLLSGLVSDTLMERAREAFRLAGVGAYYASCEPSGSGGVQLAELRVDLYCRRGRRHLLHDEPRFDGW